MAERSDKNSTDWRLLACPPRSLDLNPTELIWLLFGPISVNCGDQHSSRPQPVLRGIHITPLHLRHHNERGAARYQAGVAIQLLITHHLRHNLATDETRQQRSRNRVLESSGWRESSGNCVVPAVIVFPPSRERSGFIHTSYLPPSCHRVSLASYRAFALSHVVSDAGRLEAVADERSDAGISVVNHDGVFAPRGSKACPRVLASLLGRKKKLYLGITERSESQGSFSRQTIVGFFFRVIFAIPIPSKRRLRKDQHGWCEFGIETGKGLITFPSVMPEDIPGDGLRMTEKTHNEGAAVVERLGRRSHSTKVNRVQSQARSLRIFASENRAGRCRWSEGFLGDILFPLSLHSTAASFPPHLTLTGSHDLVVKSRPNLSTQLITKQRFHQPTCSTNVLYPCVLTAILKQGARLLLFRKSTMKHESRQCGYYVATSYVLHRINVQVWRLCLARGTMLAITRRHYTLTSIPADYELAASEHLTSESWMRRGKSGFEHPWNVTEEENGITRKHNSPPFSLPQPLSMALYATPPLLEFRFSIQHLIRCHSQWVVGYMFGYSDMDQNMTWAIKTVCESFTHSTSSNFRPLDQVAGNCKTSHRFWVCTNQGKQFSSLAVDGAALRRRTSETSVRHTNVCQSWLLPHLSRLWTGPLSTARRDLAQGGLRPKRERLFVPRLPPHQLLIIAVTIAF
ncbi:hypothetical protein PR048_000944 [Dryococelus australis]|uniref:Uncharacterized protein n=1 Tax=Dryococelus australis TaxID=614101 RepID=A0ABQ9IG04_9NEOP|nr:hypothetical protein PR048_000944 [Dryococelus australis]